MHANPTCSEDKRCRTSPAATPSINRDRSLGLGRGLATHRQFPDNVRCVEAASAVIRFAYDILSDRLNT